MESLCSELWPPVLLPLLLLLAGPLGACTSSSLLGLSVCASEATSPGWRSCAELPGMPSSLPADGLTVGGALSDAPPDAEEAEVSVDCGSSSVVGGGGVGWSLPASPVGRSTPTCATALDSAF